MKIKLLFKALKFACLPTLSILVLLICGFFSITKAIAWISSDQWFAVVLRVLLVIAEIGLVYYMYTEYDKEANFEKIRLEKKKIRDGIAAMATSSELSSLSSTTHNRRREFQEVFSHSNTDSQFRVYNTPENNIKIVEHFKS